MNHASSQLLCPAGLDTYFYFDESLLFFLSSSVFVDYLALPQGSSSVSVFSFICVCAYANVKGGASTVWMG